jgi:8-oxo-dGTP pyrophosphatase MutT (NUDIX family)
MDYVAGFLFKNAGEQVLLIRKSKPDWQKGKLNAIGGKVEVGEPIEVAMRREFIEEAGVHIRDWRLFCTLEFRGGLVHFFEATWDKTMPEPRTMESEPVMWKNTCIFTWPGDEAFIQNLRWLIPMAKDKDRVTARVINFS